VADPGAVEGGNRLGDGAVVAVTSGVRVALGTTAETLGVASAPGEGRAATGCEHAASVNASRTAIDRRSFLTTLYFFAAKPDGSAV